MNSTVKQVMVGVVTAAFIGPVSWGLASSRVRGELIELTSTVQNNTVRLTKLENSVMTVNQFDAWVKSHKDWSDQKVEVLEAHIASVRSAALEAKALGQQNNDLLREIKGKLEK